MSIERTYSANIFLTDLAIDLIGRYLPLSDQLNLRLINSHFKATIDSSEGTLVHFWLQLQKFFNECETLTSNEKQLIYNMLSDFASAQIVVNSILSSEPLFRIEDRLEGKHLVDYGKQLLLDGLVKIKQFDQSFYSYQFGKNVMVQFLTKKGLIEFIGHGVSVGSDFPVDFFRAYVSVDNLNLANELSIPCTKETELIYFERDVTKDFEEQVWIDEKLITRIFHFLNKYLPKPKVQSDYIWNELDFVQFLLLTLDFESDIGWLFFDSDRYRNFATNKVSHVQEITRRSNLLEYPLCNHIVTNFLEPFNSSIYQNIWSDVAFMESMKRKMESMSSMLIPIEEVIGFFELEFYLKYKSIFHKLMKLVEKRAGILVSLCFEKYNNHTCFAISKFQIATDENNIKCLFRLETAYSQSLNMYEIELLLDVSNEQLANRLELSTSDLPVDICTNRKTFSKLRKMWGVEKEWDDWNLFLFILAVGFTVPARYYGMSREFSFSSCPSQSRIMSELIPSLKPFFQP
jgi:hypothetical protein